MTSDKKPTEPAADIDWDDALAEWDTKRFAPEVASEIAPELKGPGSDDRPRAPVAPSRRFYRPPPSVAPVSAPPATRKVVSPEDFAEPPNMATDVLPEEVEADPFAAMPDEPVAPPKPDDAPAIRASVPSQEARAQAEASRDASPAPTTWPDERPASAWLEEAAATDTMRARAAWLEAEARVIQLPLVRARALLTCAELLAMTGDRERAHALANEARQLAPTLALVHPQARSLMSWPPDPEDYVESADAEARASAPGPARAHALLLAAEALRATGDDGGVNERVGEALRVAPSDVRVLLLRAAAPAEADNQALSPATGDPEANRVRATLQASRYVRDNTQPSPAGATLTHPTALLTRARRALHRRDLEASVLALEFLATLPGFERAARWLQAALAGATAALRPKALELLGDLLRDGDSAARRMLIARSIELQDDASAAAAGASTSLAPAERLVLEALTGVASAVHEADVASAGAVAETRPIAHASSALCEEPSTARSHRAGGATSSATGILLGRLLAADAAPDDIRATLEAMPELNGTSRGVALEIARREGRLADLSRLIEELSASLGSSSHSTHGALAAGMIAEAGGHPQRAIEAYQDALDSDPTCEMALRAVTSLTSADLPALLSTFADSCGDGVRAAMARTEAALRSGDRTGSSDLMQRAQDADPALPIPAFIAERMARGRADEASVLEWIRRTRVPADDPVEAALAAIREASLLAREDRAAAAERLLEAQRGRPADVALRQLYERSCEGQPDDAAVWAARRASSAAGDMRAILSLESAYASEHHGQAEEAHALVSVAATAGAKLAGVLLQRVELRTGRFGRLTDLWLQQAKSAVDARERREAQEQLASLDARLRHDDASALLWHRSILEDFPFHKPSLRFIEHHLIGSGRREELDPIMAAIAMTLRGSGDPEGAAHAELAGRLRRRAVPFSREAARDVIEIAVTDGRPTLWALRQSMALGRELGDDATFLAAVRQLVERASRPSDRAVLLVRAGEAAASTGALDEAFDAYERAAKEDPGDVSTLRSLSAIRKWKGDAPGAAEALEALARSSAVDSHRVRALHDAGKLWLSAGGDRVRALAAFEAAASIDPEFDDLFDRLEALYGELGMFRELADLLAGRIAKRRDAAERGVLEARRGRALSEIGDTVAARHAYEAALAMRPDDVEALSSLADLCLAQQDWEAAERALVRLARMLQSSTEQRQVYDRLGDLYSNHLLNLSRAEVALQEVIKRDPDDLPTLRKLVEIHKRQGDPVRSVEAQQAVIDRATTPAERRDRTIELATIQEELARDPRRAERTLEAARREQPVDIVLLRALVSFYQRHKQAPAIKILLDRVVGDARRALAAGHVNAEILELIAAVQDLRGRAPAGVRVRAVLAAVEGREVPWRAALEKGFDPNLDDLVAPESLGPALRSLLARLGDALDTATPVHLRDLKATALRGDAAVARFAFRVGSALGLDGLQVMSSPKLGVACVPISSPPVIVLGEAAMADERVALFLAARSLKLVRAKASALARLPSADLSVVLAAWLKCLHPTWQPAWIPSATLQQAAARLRSALPRNIDPGIGVLALEATGAMDAPPTALAAAALAWGNRVALLALGDPSSALEAIAASTRAAGPIPPEGAPRAAWIARVPEARDLVAFGVDDACAQAHARLGLDA